MDAADMMQRLLDISNAATALFDEIEKNGIDAPLDGGDALIPFVKLITTQREVSDYYQRRSVQRMLALGISPESLIRMSENLGNI